MSNISFDIQLVSATKVKSQQNFLLKWGTVFLMPFVMLFGIFSMFFIAIIARFGKPKTVVAKSESKKEEFDKNQKMIEIQGILTSAGGVELNRFYEGTLKNGLDYISLESSIELEAIEDAYFGNWCYELEDGVFLQRWNEGEGVSSDLLFLKDGIATVIKKGIKSVHWEMRQEGSDIILDCRSSKTVLQYSLRKISIS